MAKVEEACFILGGMQSQKAPDLDNLPTRIGQNIIPEDKFLDFESADFDNLPVRPEESTLRRLTAAELLPPPSSYPVPLDLDVDPDAPEFVSSQRIEFLVIMKKEGADAEPWGFPNKDQLQALFDHCRDICDHD